MIRRRIVMVFLPGFLVLLLTAVAYSLLNTTTGARFLIGRAAAWVPGGVTVGNVSGNLNEGLSLASLSFDIRATSVAVEKLDIRATFDLFPPAVSVESLSADRVLIRSRGDEARRNLAADVLAGLALPLPVNFKRLDIEQLVIEDLAADSVFTANALHLSGKWHDRLEIAEAVLETGGIDLNASGELAFTRPFSLTAAASIIIEGGQQAAAGANVPAPDMRLDARLSGTLEDMIIEATLDQPAVTVEGRARALLTTPSWDLQLKNDALQWPPVSASADTPPQATLHHLAAQITGTLHQYELKVQGVLDLHDGLEDGPAGALVGDLSVKASGDPSGLQLEQLSLSGDWIELTASGPVSWKDGLSVELTSQLGMFNPGRWFPGWPTNYPVRGSVDARWQQGQLALPAFDLQAGETDFHVSGSGDFDPEKKVFKSDLGWKSLRWPLAGDQTALHSELGQVTVSGRLEDWTVAGNVHVQAGNWPQGNLQLTGKGDLESIHLQVEHGEVLGGQFAGRASYRWVDEQPWSADFTASDLDITALTDGYPLVISGEVMASGQAQSNSFSLDIRRLTGHAHGQPLEASGAIAFEAGLVRARDLLIRSGSSHLALNGNARDPEGIRFSGQIDSLASFFDHASGSIGGEGRISLDPVSPVMELDVQGKDLAWEDWSLAEFSAGPLTSEDDGSADEFAQRMDFTGLTIGDTFIEEISLKSHGQVPFEHIRIDARRGETRLEASISGTLQGWQAPATVRWEGLLESMRLNNDGIGYLELEQAARFAVEPGAALIEPACFRGARNGQWCADMNWTGMAQKDGGHLVANANVEAVSLNILRFFFATDLEFTQTLNGTLHWEKLPGSSLVGTVLLRLTEGQIISADESASLQTGPGLFAFNIEQGKLRAGELDITLPEIGRIDTDFSAPDISRGVNSPLEGRVQVSFSSVEPFLSWLDAIDQVDGALDADIQLAGTVGNPLLTGHASLVRGRLEHLATGLVLSDITLAGAVFQDKHTELNGSFMAGDGEGRITASVTFDRILKPQVSLKLTGTNLTLINVPDMSINIDPDLDLQWYDGALQLNGSVRVPHAEISPRYLPTAAAQESTDVVIVAGQLPPVEKSAFDRSRLRITGSVAVELGEDVTLTLERATARFQGTTNFKWNNELIPIGDGSYSVTGKIAAFGQSLDVSQGKVSFPRVLANNPRLNIRAERQIYGNVQVKQAGVLISGTLKRPLLETYTRPATTEERALALLVTGHDFDYEQGVGAVEVGMYIAPKLYVSYGIGLFDNDSVVSVRYDLGRGFGVKATSSQRQSGGDIIYIIER